MRCLGRIRHHAQGSHSTPPHFPPAPRQNTTTTPPHPRHHLSPSSQTADLLTTTTHHIPTVPPLQFRSPSPLLSKSFKLRTRSLQKTTPAGPGINFTHAYPV
jgi:hypothetical protein